MNEVSLDYVCAVKLLLPVVDQIDLKLIGCGGTGSWLAPSVVRVARLLQEKFQKRVDVLFMDPDTVEPKNCYRQNFCEAEVGRNKADALAWRYGLAWGVEVRAIADRFGEGIDGIGFNRGRLVVCIGCVDNAVARRSIQGAVAGNSRWWWLDCGNYQSAGQVLLGCGALRPANPFELPGYCSWLPLPSDQHPDLLDTVPEAMQGRVTLSCADMALQDSQGLAINQRIAAEASDYLVRMLITRDLRKQATYIDLESGATRSKYIVG